MNIPSIQRAALALSFALAAGTSFAAESDVRVPAPVARGDGGAGRVLAALRKAHPGTSFDSVTSTPIAGLYQVKMGDNYAYVGATDTRYMVFGRLFDIRTLRDLTPGGAQATERAAPSQVPTPAPAPAPVRLQDLPLTDALKEVHGNGARKMAVFSDPLCAHCRRLDSQLRLLRDVTIYYFIVPFQGDELPETVWCAPDRMAAWRAAMNGTLVPGSAKCATPLERNTELATRFRVQGTPTVLFEGGRRIEGYVEAREIEAYLEHRER